MLIPHPFDSYLSSSIYLLLVFIIYKGVIQYLKLRKDSELKIRSLIPLGAIGLILGIIGHVRLYIKTFEAIEVAGDISPQIVASALGKGGSYPILGLLVLAVTFLFKYLNQAKN
jgi:hypothetical protein